MSKPFHYGGQAVIEGVMMRGKEGLAISVRQPNGQLNIMKRPLASIYRGRLREIPLVRGLIVLAETLILGTRALLHSAQIAAEEEGGEKIPTPLLAGTVAISLALGVALFLMIPLLTTRYLIAPYVQSPMLAVVFEGLIRIGIFIAYIKVIGLMPDIKRVFAYHGAEHKVVNAYEAGIPLEVEAVKKHSTAHARCGTAFIFIVLIVAILVFGLVDVLLGGPALGVRILSRIVLVPVIAVIGYEIMKFGAGHIGNPVVRVLLAPGLLLQNITAREPDDGQLEAAIAALNEVLEIDGAAAATASAASTE
ncbi:MAG: DUF1385 domain-containing protein [Dehalococcoidia bacterium]|nr:DUF1385 domain-containing protein [Dehalococcoidia bacterium]